MTLGQRLGRTASELLALQKAARSRPQKQVLAAQLQRLLEVTGTLVDANVERATPEYDAAASELEHAHHALEAALDDLAEVAEAIERTAKAVDLLAKLVVLAA